MQIHCIHNIAESLKTCLFDLNNVSKMVSNFPGTLVIHAYKKTQKSYRMR